MSIRPKWHVVAAIPMMVALGGAGCRSVATPGPVRPTARARVFIKTFDRVLVAGFLANAVSERGHDIDINAETSRLLRMALRSKASLDVIEAQPLDLWPPDRTGATGEQDALANASFWKRLGEEYRQPLILTGNVTFKSVAPKFEEHTMGQRSVRLWRPGYRLDLRLVFISGRTGEMLDSVSLGPAIAHAPNGRTSALALYFGLMDRLTPSLLAALGHHTGTTGVHHDRGR